MYIPKLRKKEHIMKDIKELDENTAITLYLINTMIKKGELTKKENSREPFKRKNLKEEDIEILLLDEEKENDKTL